jgi:ribonuclease BN (tRNA processing enzyme)
VDLIVLGCSGSYGAPGGGACSGYLVRDGSTSIWIDAGNGTFPHLQEHIDVAELSAVVLTHQHPDHCADLYGLHVMYRYGLELTGLPVYAPEGLEPTLRGLVTDWGRAFDWNVIDDESAVTIGDVALRFSRTDHPPPTYAVELTAHERRMIYTADTGPGWSVDAFGGGADLVLSEATYQDGHTGASWHLTARDAGNAAREAKARRLMLTHVWPRLDPVVSVEEGSDAYGDAVTMAAPHMVSTV